MALFDRHPGGIRVTVAGRDLLDHARVLLSQASRLGQYAEELRTGESGKVAFGIAPMLAPVLTDVVENWAREQWNADLDIYIQPVPRMADLLIKDIIEFFVGDTSRAQQAGGFTISHLETMEAGFFVRAGHPLLEKDSVTEMDLMKYPQMAPEFPDSNKSRGASGRRSRIICDDVKILKSAVLAGDVVLMGLASGLEPELSNGKIVRLSAPFASYMISHVGIVHLTGMQSVAAKRVVNQITSALSFRKN